MPVADKADVPAGTAFVTSKDGTKIAFEKVGAGPALVIVGGALSDRAGGKPFAEALKPRFSVYTYDRRGRGESGDVKPYAVERELEDLAALIEISGGSAYVYGHSSGAALALQGAAKLGAEKVTKLALYEPPYGQGERAFNEQKSGVSERIAQGQPGDAAAFFLSSIGMPPKALEAMKASPEWERIKKVDFTLAYDYAVLGNGEVPESAKSVRVPTLVMDGEKSMPFMRPTADRVAALIPNARRKTLEGQTHQVKPELLAPLLIDFFGESGGAQASADAVGQRGKAPL